MRPRTRQAAVWDCRFPPHLIHPTRDLLTSYIHHFSHPHSSRTRFQVLFVHKLNTSIITSMLSYFLRSRHLSCPPHLIHPTRGLAQSYIHPLFIHNSSIRGLWFCSSKISSQISIPLWSPISCALLFFELSRFFSFAFGACPVLLRLQFPRSPYHRLTSSLKSFKPACNFRIEFLDRRGLVSQNFERNVLNRQNLRFVILRFRIRGGGGGIRCGVRKQRGIISV